MNLFSSPAYSTGKDAEEEYELLAKAAQKDKAAFEALYRLLEKPVFHYLFRLLQNKETAEDIMIEVFSIVWKDAGRFRNRSRVKTWVFGIARNQAYNELRKKGRYAEELDERFKDEKSTSAFKGFENHQLVQKALSMVSEKHREILDLVFYHGTGYAQIAILLDIPENTVKTRVHYAKGALKKVILEMEKRGGRPV